MVLTCLYETGKYRGIGGGNNVVRTDIQITMIKVADFFLSSHFMMYYSTRDQERKSHVSFATAVMNGLAPDGGLYLPESLPSLPSAFFENIENLSDEEIAFQIARGFVDNEIPEEILRQIVKETIDFPLPVVQVKNNLYSLELYHGPTLAFKDVGARFMARVMAYFVREKWKQPVRIVVATSGDTGSAVASGFHGIEGIDVFILYPQGKVSPLQEKQLTTWGDNIYAVEMKGSFDNCQMIAKQLLSDNELKEKGWFSSANSINIARLIPQSFYYAIAYKELKKLKKPICFCVPSGNFGNISAGIMLKMMGLPVQHFLAATNANDIFPEFLSSGQYDPKPSKQTISNAMDVGAPSNFERLQQWFHHDVEEFRKVMSSVSVDDITTSKTLASVYNEESYLLDPHGAVGYYALNEFLNHHPDFVGVFLETAHPAKFVEVVEDILPKKIELPQRLQEFMNKEKSSRVCEVDYNVVKSIVSY